MTTKKPTELTIVDGLLMRDTAYEKRSAAALKGWQTRRANARDLAARADTIFAEAFGKIDAAIAAHPPAAAVLSIRDLMGIDMLGGALANATITNGRWVPGGETPNPLARVSVDMEAMWVEVQDWFARQNTFAVRAPTRRERVLAYLLNLMGVK